MSAVETTETFAAVLSTERQAAVVRELHQLAATRTALVNHVEHDLKDGLTALEEEIAAARREIPAARDEQLRIEQQSHKDQRKVIFERFEREYGTLQVEYERLVVEANKAAEHALRTEKKRLDESKWEADAVYDAAKHEPGKKFDEFKKQAEAWSERLRGERDALTRLLAQWKLEDLATLPVTPQQEFDASSGASERLQQYLATITAGREQLQQLKLPAIAAGPLAMLGTMAFALALVFPAWFLTRSPIALVVAVILAAVLGTVGKIWLQRRARANVIEHLDPVASSIAAAEAFLPRCIAAQKSLMERRQADNIAARDEGFHIAEVSYASRIAAAQSKRDALRDEYEQSYPPRMQTFVEERDRAVEQLDQGHRSRIETIQREQAVAITQAEDHYRHHFEDLHTSYAAQRQALEDSWNSGFARLRGAVGEIESSAGRLFPTWDELAANGWQSLEIVPPAIKLGDITIGLRRQPTEEETEAGLPLEPDEPRFTLPALVTSPTDLSLLLEARGNGRKEAIRTLQAYMLRLITSLPPAKTRFTIIDPVGLGENFAAFMHLGDFDEQLINRRIWTEPRHIEQRLTDLSEHMENVIQKYLRNEFKTIDEYNRYAQEVAEPFRFLVVANFPANFSEAAARRLMSIAASGPRCGVFTLISIDSEQSLPPGFSLADLRQHTTALVWRRDRFVVRDGLLAEFPLTLEQPPPDDVATRILHNAGRQAKAAGRVEVPFEAICPTPDEYWKSSSRFGIDVPLGRAGATRLQSLKLGHGTSQHVLVAGKTGSGKSTLLHALITTVALRYSPDEVELYLIDFKQGVEFKTYAVHALPHARVVAIESDREFGLSVLERLDHELKRRAEVFRKAEVQDLAGFRSAEPETPLPRVLLIVDEFQEFFVEDDRTSHESALLLDRLVRQGRAFGIHILLGSQTLAGAYSLARSTLGQMAVRIALQCSEADAHLILSEDNTAARLLSRAGEAIYNDSNGMIEGNHPFQVVWLPDERREHFSDQVIELQSQQGNGHLRPRLVFEGNVPADLEKNPLLNDWIAGRRTRGKHDADMFAWLGEAVSIKDPTAAVFRPHSGSNLLMVGQNDEAAQGMFASIMVSLAAQHPRQAPPTACGFANYLLLDGAPHNSPSSATLTNIGSVLNALFRRVAGRDIAKAIAELATEVTRRQQSPETVAAPIFVLVYSAHTLRDLRKDDDDFSFSRDEKPPSPSKQFATILREGPPVGVHVIAWCDTLNNLNRTWDRQSLREFDQRVVMQVSANDSSTLIDTPVAAKLGMHRALFADDAQSRLEKFRPYRVPPLEWIAESFPAATVQPITPTQG